jgi:iron complex outermembrane receptor protein
MRIIFLIALVFPSITLALSPHSTDTSVSLEEELSWLQAESIVFSASRNEQRVLDTAAAVFVISQQDIKRSGVTSVPEALRMAPGIQVAQVNSNTWAISSRGFNKVASNKLLVMIDGRTVYHPVFSGTLWRTKDVMLEDIDRIEVIRGPGATMWGSNAVNGVINVITKKAGDTQGLLATAGGGTEERAFGSMRYGGKLNDNIDYRAYIKYNKRDNSKSAVGGDGNDEWENIRGGFKINTDLSSSDTVTLQGDIYDGNAGAYKTIVSPVAPTSPAGNVGQDFSGGNVLGKWTHILSSTAGYSLQLYFDQAEDRTTFSTIDDSIKSTVKTYDADFQNHFQLQPWQNLTWGLGLRFVTTEINNAVNFSFSPSNRDFMLYSGFVQDELTLVPDTLKFIVGSKFEYNEYSGFEFQPNAKLIFTPDNKQTLWASVSRAVRIPNRLDHDLQSFYLSQAGPGVFVSGQGNRHFDSEQLIAYELGYRIQPIDSVLLDITAFYNDYEKLTSGEIGNPSIQTTPTPHAVIPVFPDNKGTGETYGVELMAQWQAQKWWRLQGSYSYLQMQLHTRGSSTSVSPDAAEGNSPHHQFTIRSSMDVRDNIHLDTTVRYVDNLPNKNINSYTEMDIRLAWLPVKNLELSVVGQNLLNSQHGEFTDSLFSIPMEVQRGFYGKFSWNY